MRAICHSPSGSGLQSSTDSSASTEGQMSLSLLKGDVWAVLACPQNQQQAKVSASVTAVPGPQLTEGIVG